MSEFNVEVVRIGEVIKHENADSLSITNVFGGYPVIIRTGDFLPGDLAVYVPVDSLVPLDNPLFDFLQKPGDNKPVSRIRAARLRGIFSMGLLVKADPLWVEGQNVQSELSITKWEPVVKEYRGNGLKGRIYRDPGICPKYTDLEGYRKHKDVLVPGEEVYISEKIHGANAKYAYENRQLWVYSNNTCRTKASPARSFLYRLIRPFVSWLGIDRATFWNGGKRVDASAIHDDVYWIVARQYGLEKLLRDNQDIIIYGEIIGVQDLMYGLKRGELAFVLFDIMDKKTRQYYSYDKFIGRAAQLGLPIVPFMYRGPWNPDLLSLCEGKSTYLGADHVREGVVIKPTVERDDPSIGRVALKMVGEGYLLRKNG